MSPFFALFMSSLKCDPVELESNKSKNSFCVAYELGWHSW